MDTEDWDKGGGDTVIANVLTCSVSGASQPLTFTLSKNHTTLATSRGLFLTYNTSTSVKPYGLYVCTVESIDNMSFLFEESGKIDLTGILLVMIPYAHVVTCAVDFQLEISIPQETCQDWLV